jgi:hypothetical protein
MSQILLWGDVAILNGHGPLEPEEVAQATGIPLELIQRAVARGVLPTIPAGPDAGKVPADHFKAPERYGVLPLALSSGAPSADGTTRAVPRREHG